LNNHSPNIDGDSSVDNFVPVRSKYFQHVAASHDENGDDCHTEFESNINSETEDVLLREVLYFIESAEGLEIAVSTAVTHVWNRREQIRNYLGDTLTTRDNGRIRGLYLRIIRHPNIEVIKHKPQLIVKWSKGSSSETLALDSNPA
jgi:hypothetical protein